MSLNIQQQLKLLSANVESQSAQALVNGFSFAAALAWLDVARWVVGSIVKVKPTSGSYVVLSALLTTIVAVLAFMIVGTFTKVKQQQAVLALAG